MNAIEIDGRPAGATDLEGPAALGSAQRSGDGLSGEARGCRPIFGSGALRHGRIPDASIADRAAPSSGAPPRRVPRVGRVRFRRLLCLVLVVGAALAVAAARHAASPAADADLEAISVAVERGALIVTVTEDGQVESATNVNVKCDMPGPIRVLDLVVDGAHVHEGDVLAKLDSSSIEDEILAQQIVTTKAQATKVKAEKDLAAAAIAVDEYIEGTFVQDLRKLDIDVTIARQSLTAADSAFAFAAKMHKKGYATARELKVREYAFEQARRDVGLAELKRLVLEKYTRPKILEELSSARDSAQALVISETAALQQELSKLKRYEDQLEKCTLRAPQEGMAIYANDRQGWGDTAPKIEVRARVNQFQAIVRLPDLKNMQVRTLVHENKVDSLRPGLTAAIKIQDREFAGEVTTIANQPEPSGFWQGFVKEYAVIVRIVGEPEQLKPGKTAEVRILVDQRPDVLMIPVQCVVQRGDSYYAFVKAPHGIEKRELLLGAKNDTSIEIVDGLKQGDQVLLTPRAESLEPSENP